MASSSFPIDTAELVAMYMQAIFYGIVLITVTYGMRVLLWSRDGYLKSRDRINWVMVVATLLMFTFATLEMAFGLQHNLDAFIYYTGPGGAKGKFADISNWVNVMKTVDYGAQTFIGDAILAYRCYVVYDRKWWYVIVPALLWVAESVCGWIAVYITATLHTSATLNEERLVPWITAFLSLTLAMTTITTGMIVYRILKINHGIASHGVGRVGGNQRLMRVVRVLIESGLVYTVSVAVFFSTFLASNNAQYPVSDVIVQLIPISFVLIIIRADQSAAAESASFQQASFPGPKPITFPVRHSLPGADAPQGTPVSRTFSGIRRDTYMMKDIGSEGDGWKASELDMV